MKKTLILTTCLLFAIFINAQSYKTINVLNGGGLSAAITAEGLDPQTVTRLAITGVIDSSDFKTMRDNMPALIELDLSGATIVQNAIPDNAFYNSRNGIGKTDLKAISLPNSIKSIGQYAFWGCSTLSNVTIPDSVTSIGLSAFARCSRFTKIEIPKSVTSIGPNAFGDCRGLIMVDSNNPNYSSKDNVLFSKDEKTLIQASTSKTGSYAIPSTVDSIGNLAFWNCLGLSSIIIPNSVTSIGDDAFLLCSGLDSVIIPESVTSIGVNAFSYCTGLSKLTILSSSTPIGNFAFSYCTELISIRIPNSIDSIGNGAFSNCTNLTGLALPNSVKTIGDQAFYGCTGLSDVILPNSVISIGNMAFGNCINLTNLVISNSVIKIGRSAFNGCIGLASITIPKSVKSIGVDAFSDFNGLIAVEPENLNYSSQRGILFNKDQTTLIQAPTSINGNYTIPTSVVSIENDAFKYCANLTGITIPNSVKSIGISAFDDCTKLTSITIPKSVTSIGNDALKSCSILAVDPKNRNYSSKDNVLFNKKQKVLIQVPFSKSGSYVIPSTVKSINEYAFYGCNELDSITIPKSVKTIGDFAFSNCRNLSSIYIFASTPATLKSDVFFRVDKSHCTISVPKSSIRIYQLTSGWNDFLSIIELPK
jgi:hypothetical protein